MNAYKAGNPIQNVYEDTLTSRVKSYKHNLEGQAVSSQQQANPEQLPEQPSTTKKETINHKEKQA